MFAYAYIKKQSEHDFERSFFLYAARMDENLMNAAYHLLDYSINSMDDNDFWKTSDDVDYIYAVRNLKLNYMTLENLENSFYSYFLYDKYTGRFIEAHPQILMGKEQQMIANDVLKDVEDSELISEMSRNAWGIRMTDSGPYLLRVFQFKHYVTGMWIKADKAFSMVGVKASDTSFPVLIHEKGSIHMLNGETDNLAYDMAGWQRGLEGRSVYKYNMQSGHFSVAYILDNKRAYLNLMSLQAIPALISLLMVTLGLMMLHNVRINIVRPIEDISEHLAIYHQQGTLANTNILELSEAREIVGKLLEQLEDLKIEIYEKELTRQNIEYAFLEGQIRPHFYLNCMNIIYNMVEAGQDKEIQKFSLLVSRYLRDLFKDGLKKYRLSEELDLIRDYLEIQKIRYDAFFKCDVKTADTCDADNTFIPPLVLLTFVENSLKHNLEPDHDLIIRIDIDKNEDDDGRWILFHIEDNGKGFPMEIMKSFNNKKELRRPASGKGIGIWNCMQRLDIVYQGNYRIHLFNNGENGAVVQISLPEEGYV